MGLVNLTINGLKPLLNISGANQTFIFDPTQNVTGLILRNRYVPPSSQSVGTNFLALENGFGNGFRLRNTITNGGGYGNCFWELYSSDISIPPINLFNYDELTDTIIFDKVVTLTQGLTIGIELTGAISASGTTAAPIVTTFNMTLDQLGIANNISLSNGTTSFNIINSLDPVNPQDLATKNYIDTHIWTTSQITDFSSAISSYNYATQTYVDDHSWLAANITDLASVVQAYTLDLFAEPINNISLNNNQINNLAAGSLNDDAINLGQLNSAVTTINQTIANISQYEGLTLTGAVTGTTTGNTLSTTLTNINSNQINDLASTVQAYTLDSFAAPIANFNANSNLINNLANGVLSTDAINLGQLNSAIAGVTPYEGLTLTGVITGSTTGTSLTTSFTPNPVFDRVTINNAPITSTDAVNQAYVQSLIAGLNFKNSCLVATTANLNSTYVNGTAGVGATLTNNGILAAFTLDDITPAVNSRILVKNQISQLQNGIYTLMEVGSNSVPWVLTRSTDYDTAGEINSGDLIAIESGIININTVWLQSTPSVVVGTDNIIFTQFVYGPSSFLQVNNNLSDLANAATARTNLGNVTTQSYVDAKTWPITLSGAITGSGNTGGSITTTLTNINTSQINDYISATNSLITGYGYATQTYVNNKTWTISQITNFYTGVLSSFAVPTSALNLNSQKIINLANGTANSDAVNLGQMNAADINTLSSATLYTDNYQFSSVSNSDVAISGSLGSGLNATLSNNLSVRANQTFNLTGATSSFNILSQYTGTIADLTLALSRKDNSHGFFLQTSLQSSLGASESISLYRNSGGSRENVFTYDSSPQLLNFYKPVSFNSSPVTGILNGTAPDSAVNLYQLTTALFNPVFTGRFSATLPIGTTLERPSSSTFGMIRANSTIGNIELYSGSSWLAINTSNASVSSVSLALASGTTGLSLSGSTITTSGTYTLGLNTELQALSTLSNLGLLVRTGSGSYSTNTYPNNTNTFLRGDGTWVTPPNSGGTVTSVGLTTSTTTGLLITNPTITASGNINVNLNNELDSLSKLSTVGLISRNGAGTYTPVTLTAGTGINITNGNGVGTPVISATNFGTVTSVGITTTTNGLTVSSTPVTASGNLSVALNTELQALATQSSLGYLTRTAAGTYAERSFSGSNGVTLTNPAGTAGNTSIGLSNVPASVLSGYPTNALVYLNGMGAWTDPLQYTSSSTGYFAQLTTSATSPIALGYRIGSTAVVNKFTFSVDFLNNTGRIDSNLIPIVISTANNGVSTPAMIIDTSNNVTMYDQATITMSNNNRPLIFNTDSSVTSSALGIGYQINGTDKLFIGYNQSTDVCRIRTYTSTTDISFNINGATNDAIRVKASGQVGINTNAPDQALTVIGNASKTTAGSWVAFSDVRIKDITGEYKTGLEQIKQLTPKTFKFNKNSEYPNSELGLERIGFIAQEIEGVIPECITQIKSRGYKDLRVYDPSAIIYMLINAVKELNIKIETLENRI